MSYFENGCDGTELIYSMVMINQGNADGLYR
jgi:hypothetical protein